MTSRSRAFDLVISVAVGVGCTLEVWAPSVFGSTHMTGPRAAVFGSYLVGAAALAVRRRFPLAVAVVVSGALAIEWVAFGAPEGFGVFAIPVIAGYTVAGYEDRRRALGGLAVLLAACFVWSVRDPVPGSLREHAVTLVWLSPVVIGWLLGAYLRTRRLYMQALHERADRAEQEREERAQAAVASERTRIARELHDILAHNVSVIVVQAEAADEMLDRDMPDRARIPVWKIQETGRAALTDMRRMLGILREGDSPALTPQPGIANLQSLLAQVRESGLAVELEVRGEPEPLPPGVDLSAYRIVQEALTNALKYAGPAYARVVVDFTPGLLALEIEDDGAGAPVGANGGGHGLVGMRERVGLFGGDVEAGPKADGGYRVSARLPLETGT